MCQYIGCYYLSDLLVQKVYGGDKTHKLLRFKHILDDFDKEWRALNYDYQRFDKLKNIEKRNDRNLQLNEKVKDEIKSRIKNSDQMLKQMIRGLRHPDLQ